MSDMFFIDREPRQLGTLHDRMACVLHLMHARLGSDGGENTDLWHAVYDLATLVEHLPDAAFHRKTDAIVPATHRMAKRGTARPDWDCRGRTTRRRSEREEIAALQRFVRNFVALFQDADMRPEDECRALYAEARQLMILPDQPATDGPTQGA